MNRLWILLAFLLVAHGGAAEAFVHGLWIWKTPSVLAAPGSEEALKDFWQADGINGGLRLHARPRVCRPGDAAARGHSLPARGPHSGGSLLDSIDADLPGRPREKLLGQVKEIVRFNADHPAVSGES